jgi:hypothetical protein
MELYTIGHSNHPLPRFVELLRRHVIDLVADVRSVPHSRRYPQFNRESLERGLGEAGIGYAFLGRELGARADDPLLYENGRVSYAKLAATGLFQFGLDRLRGLAASKHTAIMCAEKEPLDCHRTLLVARWMLVGPALAGHGIGGLKPALQVEITHILADGSLESHHECMLRLVKMTKPPAGDLFRTEAELIDEACAKREEKIAFRRPDKSGPTWRDL